MGAKERYPSRVSPQGPTLPDDPDVKIEQAGCVGKAGDNLPFDWDWVLIDLLIEALTQGSDVFSSIRP